MIPESKRSVKVGEVGRLIDVDLTAFEPRFNERRGWIHQKAAGAGVALQRKQVWKDRAGENGGDASNARVDRGDDGWIALLRKCPQQRRQVFRRDARLVAGHEQSAFDREPVLLRSLQAGADGTRNTFLPIRVQHYRRVRQRYDASNLFRMRAQDNQNRPCACLARHANRARKQRLPLKLDKLLGPAKAAAGPGGEEDRGDRRSGGHGCVSDSGRVRISRTIPAIANKRNAGSSPFQVRDCHIRNHSPPTAMNATNHIISESVSARIATPLAWLNASAGP